MHINYKFACALGNAFGERYLYKRIPASKSFLTCLKEGRGWGKETFEKCSILFKVKEGEDFNRRNTR
jgi:hypothetical protein